MDMNLGKLGKMVRDREMSIIYGDYYFAEAILKLKGSDFLPW